MKILKTVSLVILVLFYVIAGINHFINPQGYIRIIPYWLHNPALLNTLAGTAEVLLGMLLLFKPARQIAAWLIMAMLIAFLPVHIDMVVHAPLQVGSLRVTPLIAWLRLVIQPLLILWAWWHTKNDQAGK